MRKLIIRIVFIFAVLFSINGIAQKFPALDKSPLDIAAYPSSYRVSDKTIKVIYSRPQLKGRALAKLAPVEKVWRTGANEAAEIIFYKDVVFGDKEVKAGTYSLFTIPGEKTWTIILNNDKNVWGAYMYNKDEDVARVKASVSKNTKNVEAFSIVFEGEGEAFTMFLAWGKTIVTLPIKG